MDRDDESPFVGGRKNSFPHDRSYPSSAPQDQNVEKNIEEPLFGHHRLHRQGTTDLENRKSNKRLRYTIPLRHKRTRQRDEEHGILDEKEHNAETPTRPGLERDVSRGGPPYGPDELCEIISTQFWVPDDDGQEVVTLTVKDDTANRKQEKLRCESRWRHIQSEAITFRQFRKEVMRLPGLEDDELALAGRLLNKVQKTCEKQFIHGRYLKPIVLVYDGADPEGDFQEPKTATFISLPIFTTDVPKHHTSTKENEGHPVRALLQSRYRLESTKSRDKGQVIRKVQRHRDHVVYVPQIWALIINKHTIITCAPLNTSTLRGNTIRIMKYADAQLDEATWSIHFADARGTVFYLPLRFCKTWFGLVKQITTDCLQDEYDLIRDQLLRGGPLYELVTEDGISVTAETWPTMIENERSEVIRLKLVDNEAKSNRLLVTYCDAEGNEIPYEMDSSSDASSLFSLDDVESDATDYSISNVPKFDRIPPALDKLQSLREKLERAMSQGDDKRIESLRDHKIPTLEDRILALVAADLERERKKTSHHSKEARFAMPEPNGHRRGSSGRARENNVSSAAAGHASRRRSRSRSGSGSGRRLSRGFSHYFQSTHDTSLNEPDPRTRPKRPPIAYNRSKSFSQPQSIFGNYSFPPRSGEASRRQSYATIAPSQLTIPPGSLHSSRSHWDTIRSRVFNGPTFDATSTPISPKTDKKDIYYKPSNKQLARSRWEFLRNHILAGTDVSQSNGQPTEQGSVEPASPRVREKLANAMKLMLGDETPGSPKTASAPPNPSGVQKDHAGEHLSKRVKFSKRSQEAKPKLKRLITRAHKEVSKVTSPHAGTAPPTETLKSPIVPTEAQNLPIFLWSTVHKPASVPEFSLTSKAASMDRLQSTDQALLDNVAANVKNNTSKEELILRTVVLEIHANLRKPKKVPREYADLYEQIAGKTVADVTGLIAGMDSGDSHMNGTDRTAGLTPLNSPGIKTPINLDSIETRKRLKDARAAIRDVASQILYAFVPDGYEAAVVSKYWGAIYQIINQKPRVRATYLSPFYLSMLNYIQDEAILEAIAVRLLNIHDLVRSIQLGVRTDDGSKQARYQIPRALPAAFQHLVMLLVVASTVQNWSDHSWNQMLTTFDECENLFLEGRKQLILMIHTDDYRESAGFQAVDSEALLSLILANLISHLSEEREFHLTEVYSEYTTRIQSVVRDSASVKVYDDIKLLREELDVIKNTLKQQDETLRDFRSTISAPEGVASLSLSVIDRILESVEQRIDDFNELQGQAETARFLAAQSISLKAESNNKAIIVFTVVTIIFLPLSFVTSYLGMNTSDLRNMKSNQTLFWEIGAPVAVFILSAALVAAFYGTLTQRLTGRAWRGKEKAE